MTLGHRFTSDLNRYFECKLSLSSLRVSGPDGRKVHAGYKDSCLCLPLASPRSHVLSHRLQHGRVPLHACALAGKEKTAAILLEHGAEVDARDTDGNTPLILAARYGNVAMVKALLTAKADFKAVNKAGHTAVDASRHAGSKVRLPAALAESALRCCSNVDIIDGAMILSAATADAALRCALPPCGIEGGIKGADYHGCVSLSLALVLCRMPRRSKTFLWTLSSMRRRASNRKAATASALLRCGL